MNVIPQEPGARSPPRVHPLRWLTVPLFCLLVAQSGQASEPARATPEQLYQLALEARTARDYPAMLSFLRRAGEAGDPDAQELLGSVLLTGATLYGKAIRADPCEAAYWIRRAMASGSDVAMHQNLVLNHLRELPKGRDSCAARMR